MSELREQLARRLHDASYGGADVDLRAAWESVGKGVRERTWLMVADECLRQMEWAREQAWRQGRASGFNAATYWPSEELREQSQGPIRRLAPEGWKP